MGRSKGLDPAASFVQSGDCTVDTEVIAWVFLFLFNFFLIVVKCTEHKTFHFNRFYVYSSIIHVVGQPSPLFISRTLHHAQLEVSPSTLTAHPPSPPAPGNLHAPFCLWEFDYSEHPL